MLGFKCRQAVMERSHARGHSAKPPAAAAQLSCRRRSRQQLGACADDLHTNRKILRRPFSRCGTGWPTPKTKYISSPRAQQDADGVQLSLHSDLADFHEHVERAGLGQVDRDGAVRDRQAPHLPAATMLHVLSSTSLRNSRRAQCARAASSRRAAAAARRSARTGRTHHGRARVLAPPPRATRASRPTGITYVTI